MSYPDKPIEFIKGYSFKDKNEVYTNGAELVPMFRVKQTMEYYMPSWIPVTERLPVEETEVLACNNEGIYHLGFVKKVGDNIICKESPFLIDNVVAWMPLPAPYKSSGLEKE